MRDIPELHVPVTTETKTNIVDSVKPQIADHPSVNTHSFIHSFISLFPHYRDYNEICD